MSNISLLTIKEYLIKYHNDVNYLYIDKLWENISDDKWIYIDNELINWIGYKTFNKGKEKYLYLIKKHFKIKIDYKIFNSDELKQNKDIFCSSPQGSKNKETRGGKNKKYIYISPKCFKKSLMLIKTKKSEDIRDYYIELEEIFKKYNKYQINYQNKLLENNKKILENKDKELENNKKIIDTLKGKHLQL